MARRIFEHRCQSCGILSEHLVEFEEVNQECPACGDNAVRVVSAPKLDYLHMGIDKDGLPTAGDKWAKMHRAAAGHGKQ